MNVHEKTVKTKEGKIVCSREQLDLGITLKGGQSFRWASEDNNEYRGVFDGCVWTLSQDETHLRYTVQGSLKDITNYDDILSRYLRLDVSLTDLCKEWSSMDEHFQKSLDKTRGVRILNQEVVENVFSFICSSNNNIKRITLMVEKLCSLFGEKICSVNDKDYYDFPTIEVLTRENVEEQLKKEKFGYRAKYIVQTAKTLIKFGGKDWLLGLHKENDMSYNKAKEELMKLPGVGPKVADCVCLMSLGHLEAVPVDTHIKQIAESIYLRKRPISNEQVSDHFRKLWGLYAGWAQAVVFCAKINNNDTVSSKTKRKTRSPRGTSDKKFCT